MHARSLILPAAALALVLALGGCRKPQGPVTNEANSATNAAPLNAAPVNGFSAVPEEAAAIRVSEASVAPGASNAAIYLTIDNDGGADRLTAIDGKGLGPITLHQSSMDSGVMRMRALPGGIAVAAHGQTKLAPMGLHAMIEPLTHPLRPGDSAMLTLRFERQGEVEVTAPIRAPGEAP